MKKITPPKDTNSSTIRLKDVETGEDAGWRRYMFTGKTNQWSQRSYTEASEFNPGSREGSQQRRGKGSGWGNQTHGWKDQHHGIKT